MREKNKKLYTVLLCHNSLRKEGQGLDCEVIKSEMNPLVTEN